MSIFSNVEFSFEIATSVSILAAASVAFYQMTTRRRKEAADRFSEQARSFVLGQVNKATERLAQLDFQIKISRRDAWQLWERRMNTKPYMLEVEDQEFEFHLNPDAEMSKNKTIPLRNLEVRQLQKYTDVLNILDPLVLAFQDFSKEIDIHSQTVAPYLKPTVTGTTSIQTTLTQRFEMLGKEIKQQYLGLKDGVNFMQNVDLALKRSHRVITVTSTPVPEDWIILRTHLKQSLTKSDFCLAAPCLTTTLKMPFDRCETGDDLIEHEREVLNEFSKLLANDPEAYIHFCFPTIMEYSKSFDEISSRLLLILSCTTDRLVSETGISATERYVKLEALLPKRPKTSEGSASAT